MSVLYHFFYDFCCFDPSVGHGNTVQQPSEWDGQSERSIALCLVLYRKAATNGSRMAQIMTSSASYPPWNGKSRKTVVMLCGHRRRRRDTEGSCPLPNSGEKIFFGQTSCNIRAVDIIFHTYIFGQKCLAPQSQLSSYAYVCGRGVKAVMVHSKLTCW